MTRRFSRRRTGVDLARRAADLARRYRLPTPEIRLVSNMRERWGSCTPGTGTIRISDRMATFPGWVLDYVLVHELAHLRHADHSAAFHELEHRYPKAERAIGYLIAKSGGEAGGEAGGTGLD